MQDTLTVERDEDRETVAGTTDTAVRPDALKAENASIALDGVFDIAGFREELERIAKDDRAGGGSTEARAKVLETTRTSIREGRKAAETLLFSDGSGLNCARRLAGIQDAVIAALHDFALTHVFPASNLSAGERMAVLAVGGYGRGTLAPGSDIDLLFLLPYKQTPLCEQVIEYLLYLLWDAGFKVGHASRNVTECIKLAKADDTIRTAILERWLIVGDKALAEELDSRFQAEVVAGTSPDFIAAKLAERAARHAKVGNSRYLVEPNVKEGKGGLRDLNTLFWIAKDNYQVDTTGALVEAGVFSRSEAKLFLKAEDFLWAVRCHMHFVTGKAEERLSFDLQPEIAARLGYNAHPGLKDVERFMKHYFLIAKDVGDLTRIFCAVLEEQNAKAAPGLRGLVRSLRGRARKIPGTLDFVIDNNRITVAHAKVFQDDPVNLIRIFRLASLHRLGYHPDALKLVRRSLRLIGPDLRANPDANSLFLDVLTDANDPGLHLRRMNEAGVLGRFIPEFGKIVGMMQFNMYHHYTVDEHLLRSIDELSAIEKGDLGEQVPLSTELVRDLPDRMLLYVALLLHDIAKGRPEDHSTAGARIARELCPRFGLDARETDLVAWLVEDHLTMSMTAQHRDLADRKTILDFVERVRTLDRLKLLTILTVCDIRAVGPGVWNGWKGQLIRTLYVEAEPTLTGGFTQRSREARVERARADLAEALADWNADERGAYLDLHYPNYFLTVPLEDQVRHAAFIREARDGPPLASEVRTDAFRAMTELTVLAPDHPRLLSLVAGACAGAGANIADAQIFTLTDGRALDIITLNREFEVESDELRRAERIRANVDALIKGQRMPADLVARRKLPRSRTLFEVPANVRVDNALSNKLTVVEIEGLDRPGLLSDLTGALSDLNLDIHSAHIATYGEKVVDVFYVTDLIGAKIVSETRIERIQTRIARVFDDPVGEVTSAKTMASAHAFGYPEK